MKLVLIALLVAYATAELYEDHIAEFIGDNGDWTGAIHEPFRGWDMEKVKKFLGTKLDVWNRNPKYQTEEEMGLVQGTPYSGNWDITKNAAWANCKATFTHIKDQADCGSCWAVAASEVVEDRTCIKCASSVTAGTLVEFSGENIMSCCNWCGDGCEGGYPIDAMRYWVYNGVPTGGPYGSNCGCQPYQIPPCGPQGCRGPIAQTPQCSKSCRQGYNKNEGQDAQKGNTYYMLQASGSKNVVQVLQDEIYSKGTIECAFTVKSSFLAYHSGVYTSCSGRVDGGHAITVVGWGTSNSIPYWIVKNSWNVSWGMQGYIWMKRGVNLCGIEEQCVAGTPSTSGSCNGVTLKC